MTKQELLKQYPDLVRVISGELFSLHTQREANSGRFDKTFKEYVKDQVKPEWTILSFEHVDRLITLRENGRYLWEKANPEIAGASLEVMFDLMEDDGYKIHSVRRESDGEIFTVGDYIEWEGRHATQLIPIIEIKWYSGDNISLQSRQSSTTAYCVPITQATKARVLFTTEDEVDIYEGNKYWVINHWRIMEKTASRGKYTAIPGYYFSTQKAAEEYIYMNKPVISVQILVDYIKAGGEHSIEGLKELAKSKINAT